MEKKLSFSEVLKKYTIVIVLVLVVIMFTVNTKGVMLLPQNVNNLVAQNAYVFILATGMLFCILTGGNIDLSVGSVVCFVAAVGGTAIKMVLICAVVLAFMFRLAQYKGIPNSLVWVAVIIAIYTYVASKTTTGRYFYAVGGNEKAMKLSGINTNKVYFLAYLNMGLLAAIAGMVTMARLNSANPQAGTNFEMDAIGSCFIGGASAYGGTGTVPGVIIGALLMGVLNLGMSIMGIDQNIQKVVKGLVLLAAVIFDVVSKRKSFIVK